MAWIQSFNGIFSIDSANTLRTFNLSNQIHDSCQGQNDQVIPEILKPSNSKQLENTNGVIVKLDVIPNQLSIVSLKIHDCDFPSVNLKVLDLGIQYN